MAPTPNLPPPTSTSSALSATQSAQWYAWGPPNMQCRLCASCWIYWKKYGGLKTPTQLEGAARGTTVRLMGQEGEAVAFGVNLGEGQDTQLHVWGWLDVLGREGQGGVGARRSGWW